MLNQNLDTKSDDELASELEAAILKYGSGSHFARCIEAEQRRRVAKSPVSVITVRLTPAERRLVGQAARTAEASLNRWCVGQLVQAAQAVVEQETSPPIQEPS